MKQSSAGRVKGNCAMSNSVRVSDIEAVQASVATFWGVRMLFCTPESQLIVQACNEQAEVLSVPQSGPYVSTMGSVRASVFLLLLILAAAVLKLDLRVSPTAAKDILLDACLLI